jgi:hypothetical protein
MAWRLATSAERELIRAVALAASLGLLATLLGADIAGNVLAVNLQPWRSLWIATLIGNAWAAVVFLRLPQGRISRELLLFALGSGAAAYLTGVADVISSAALIAAGASFLWEERTMRPLPLVPRIAARSVIVGLAGLLGYLIFYIVRKKAAFDHFDLFCISVSLWILTVGLLIRFAGERVTRGSIVAAMIVALTATAVADRRSAWMLFAEDESVPPGLAGFVADSGNLYWEAGVEFVWFKLKRPSYYSCLQGTGAMFYAGTALEYQRRSKALAGLNTRDFAESSEDPCVPKLNPEQRGPVRKEQLTVSCQALPELDTVILTQAIPGVKHTSWQSPVPQILPGKEGPEQVTVFYRYSCSNFRSADPSS